MAEADDRFLMTDAEWLAKHRDHGDLTTEPHQHPDGTWQILVCECGARHTTMKVPGEVDCRRRATRSPGPG